MDNNQLKTTSAKLAEPLPRTSQQSMVDLHGLSPERARQSVNWHMSIAEQANVSLFRFVTGRGNHVNNSGERGTLFREFPNWLSDEHLNKIVYIKQRDGHYEIAMKPTVGIKNLETGFEELGQLWLINNSENIRLSAENNDSFSQYLLGHCYQYGVGLEQDYTKAVSWYEKSAKNNNPNAQYALGGCYWQGQGIRQNDQKAIQLFEEAAAQNHPWAFHQLGDVYHYGDGVKPDAVLSLSYYQKASDLGINIATRKLGHAYYYGYGIQQDAKKGFSLYKIAADNGDAHSAYNVACAYLHGDGVAENVELAFQYAKFAADKNDPDAQYLTSMLYVSGQGVAKDTSLGFEYLKRAADNNYKHALYLLAFYTKIEASQRETYLIKAAEAGQINAQAMLIHSSLAAKLPKAQYENIYQKFWKQSDEAVLSIPDESLKFLVIDSYIMSDNLSKKQKSKIVRLLTALVEQKNARALERLGGLYHQGDIVNKNLKKAVHYWQQGAELGSNRCMCCLGYYYEDEAKSDPIQYQNSFTFHERAANLNDANSCNQLGTHYKRGLGTEQNLQKALAYYLQAIELDSGENKRKQQDGLFYRPVYPHATLNIGALYLNMSDPIQGVYWLIKSAEAGQEDAKKLLEQLNIPADSPLYQANAKTEFWKQQKKQPAEVKVEPIEVLKEIAGLLKIRADWKITQRDDAWCYLSSSDKERLQQYSLEPITIRKTKTGEYILLLEKISKHNILEVKDKIEMQIINVKSARLNCNN